LGLLKKDKRRKKFGGELLDFFVTLILETLKRVLEMRKKSRKGKK